MKAAVVGPRVCGFGIRSADIDYFVPVRLA